MSFLSKLNSILTIGRCDRPLVVNGSPTGRSHRPLVVKELKGGFWARGFEYELLDDFLLPLIVTRTLGHIRCQVLVAKIPIGHGGESNPQTSDLESDTLTL